MHAACTLVAAAPEEKSMALPRTEVVQGFTDEMIQLSGLVRSLDETELATPTRCAGWTAADTAAHVAGTLADIIAGRMEGLGTPEVTQRAVDERQGRSAGDLADELEQVAKIGADILASFDDEAWSGPGPAGVNGTLGYGVESLWYDAYLHGDDIRAAIGKPSVYGPGLRAAVSHVTDTLDMNDWSGQVPVTVDSEPHDMHAFVLAGTGRADPSTIGLDETVNIYG
jgi:uncharacterized protein (TIGR03083 family)